MLEAFQKYLTCLEPIPADKKFLLAVSGGLDSIVMTELFRLARYNYYMAHCNFQLRGKESDGDEFFVKKLAAKSNVPFFSVKFETAKFCSENKMSVQMGARQLRYDWLEQIRVKNRLDYIVTAHHADDAIETFFINLLRGTGLSGLHGIKSKHENNIRPMLSLYRNEIEDFATKSKLKWREDSSNDTDKYERNKIRHHLLPALQNINPKAKEAVARTIENLGKTEIVLNNSINKITKKFITKDGSRILIHFDFFKELAPAVEYLYETIKKMGFNYEQCLQISESIKGQPGKIFLSGTHRILIDRQNLICEFKIQKEENETYEVANDLKKLSYQNHAYNFRVIKNTKNGKILSGPEKVSLDFDKLTFPLKIRKWAKGDKFYPLGMKRPKKVSDFLIDNKVSLFDKSCLYVLVSGDAIAWLIGYRLDERFKVTNATKNLYLCEFKKSNSA